MSPTRTLYYFSLSPFARKVRILLIEKNLSHDLVEEPFWKRRKAFIAINPAAQVPVVKEENGLVLAESTAICEYLEEVYPSPILLGQSVEQKYHVRRISGWFNNKFYYEVTKHVLDEKVIRHLKNQGPPRSSILRVARNNIGYHLDYIAHLTRQNHWLAGNYFSLADITAAAQLSVLDYLGYVDWSHNKQAKSWYALVKSRPSVQPILMEQVQGFTPPKHYLNLDF